MPTLVASGSHQAPSPQRIRPGAEVVERRERAGEAGGVARPDVDDAGADLDPLGGRGERGHRHDGVADEPAVGLPHGVEAGRLGLTHVLDALAIGWASCRYRATG